MTYNQFLKKELSLSPFGIQPGDDSDRCFCTPKDAEIFGRTGVDGIHYCFIRGFGEMVFAVSPMNGPGDFVHPVARNFTDFLRLLLTCGGEACVEQGWRMSKPAFETEIWENPPEPKQQAAMDSLAKALDLTPMAEPYDYIKAIQDNFDFSEIKFTKEYDEWVPPAPELPEWKVTFAGGFSGPSGRERAGKEIPVNKAFHWGGDDGLIPSIYCCAKGLVVDFCVRRSANDGEELSFTPSAVVNGKVLHLSDGYGLRWEPNLSAEFAQDMEAQAAVAHYGLDPKEGWLIWRHCFPWATKGKPKMRTVSVTLTPHPAAIPGTTFRAEKAGDIVAFVHPLTKIQHTLTVTKLEQKELPDGVFHEPEYDYPRRYTLLTCTVQPELTAGSLQIQDCGAGDQPRPKMQEGAQFLPQTQSSVSFALVGRGEKGEETAASTLHFQPVESVQWRMTFYAKRLDDMTIEIMP